MWRRPEAGFLEAVVIADVDLVILHETEALDVVLELPGLLELVELALRGRLDALFLAGEEGGPPSLGGRLLVVVGLLERFLAAGHGLISQNSQTF